MTDGRPEACMTDDRPKACHDTRQAEGLHMTHDSHPRELCQCLVRGALGGLGCPAVTATALLAPHSPCICTFNLHF